MAKPKVTSTDAPAPATNKSSEAQSSRDVLVDALTALSAAFDRAVKAYIAHTDVTIAHNATTAPPTVTVNTETVEDSTGKKKKAKKEKKEKDPNAPKRPLTAYFRYLGEVRPVIAAELAELAENDDTITQKAGDISRTATDRWNKMTKEEQSPYYEAYRDEAVGYKTELAKHVASLPSSKQKAIIAAVEDDENDAEAADQLQAEAAADSSTDSDSSSDDEPSPPPPPPAKTPKSAKKVSKPVPTPAPAPSQPMFSSINPFSKKRKSEGAPAAEETAAKTAETPAKKQKKKKNRISEV